VKTWFYTLVDFIDFYLFLYAADDKVPGFALLLHVTPQSRGVTTVATKRLDLHESSNATGMGSSSCR